ncbi:MAG: SRPBCC domain-containing protein [Melioribacteraceae bacterium]|nr:SRPBCC domain-containing protein [Melioribacteraceae bacterium]
MKTTDEPIIVEEEFNQPTSKVWKAITEVDQMRKWFFTNILDFKPEIGFETQFNVSSGERDFLHLWKIVEVTPNKLIKYNWKYKDYSGDSFVTFELDDHGSKSLLRVTTEVIEDFSDDIPEFKPESCKGGWEYFIQNSLKSYLDS